MSELYLRFFQEVENYNGQLINNCLVLVEHSSSITFEDALLRAEKQLAKDDFIITKVEFPYIWCYKFENLKEEE